MILKAGCKPSLGSLELSMPDELADFSCCLLFSFTSELGFSSILWGLAMASLPDLIPSFLIEFYSSSTFVLLFSYLYYIGGFCMAKHWDLDFTTLILGVLASSLFSFKDVAAICLGVMDKTYFSYFP